MSGPNSWRRPSRSGGPSAQPHRERSRSREPHGSCATSFRTKEFGKAHRRPSDHDGAHADARGRPDRSREDSILSGSRYHTEHCASSSPLSQWRVGDDRDRRPDARRAGLDDGHREPEQRHDAMRACSPRRISNSLVYSHQRDEGRSEPRRDRQGFASHQQGCRHTGHDEPRDNRAPHRSALLPHAQGEVRRECRQPTGNDSGNGGRPSAKQL